MRLSLGRIDKMIHSLDSATPELDNRADVTRVQVQVDTVESPGIDNCLADGSEVLDREHYGPTVVGQVDTVESPGVEDSPADGSDRLDRGHYGPDVVATEMCRCDNLRSFWEFATTVRRTWSLCKRMSAKLRGTWLTQTLVVERIEGWGTRHVRILCIVAPSAGDQSRLQLFFESDDINLDGGLAYAQDSLRNEPRAIVKVPYAKRVQPIVLREYKVLSSLAGIEGIPQVQGLLYFTDVAITASVTKYVVGETLHARLERSSLAELYDLYRLLSRGLSILACAHKRGWIHAGLQPRHVVINHAGAVVQLCGWSSASPWPPPNTDLQGLAEEGLVAQLAAKTAAAEARAAEALAAAQGEVTEMPAESISEKSGSEDCDEESDVVLDTVALPSLYSAPEDFISVAIQQPYATPATDVYRMGAVGLAAVRAYGPLGANGRLLAPNLVEPLAEIRSRCNEAVSARSRVKAARKPEAEAWSTVAKTLRALSDALFPLSSCFHEANFGVAYEFEAWFTKSLAKEPGERFWTMEEALDALDEVWRPIELRWLETKQMEAADAESREAAPMMEEAYLAYLQERSEVDECASPRSIGRTSTARGSIGQTSSVASAAGRLARR